LSKYGDLPFGAVPRHRDRSRFGFHNTEKEWVPYEDITEGLLLFSCGHTARIAVGNAPGLSEDVVRAFVAKAASGQCAVCWSVKGRLRYQADTGKVGEAKRERD
jgi:hypothetical protein